MAVNTSEENQDAYAIDVLPNEGVIEQQRESQLAFLSLVEITEPPKSLLCLTKSKSLNHVNVEMEICDGYLPFIMDMDVEKGKLLTPKTNDEIAANLKNGDQLTRTLQRQVSIQIGGKFMQQLMNYCFMLPKFNSRDKSAAERIYDPPNNRSRKFKRSASFNSRKIVLLFSILSSMGTIILIYLTLRVRQMADASILAYN